MTTPDELFNEARDKALYAFEGETNIHLLDDERAVSLAYASWEMGFADGWTAAVQAVLVSVKK